MIPQVLKTCIQVFKAVMMGLEKCRGKNSMYHRRSSKNNRGRFKAESSR